ncbi:MAG: putative sugar nucleotidyl transferase [bacterium]
MICIYEGNFWRNFGPLVDLRAIFEIRCGVSNLLEKIKKVYPREKVVLWVRDELAGVVAERYPGVLINVPVSVPALLLYAGTILYEPVPVQGGEESFIVNNKTIGFRLNRSVSRKLLPKLRGFRKKDVSADAVFYPWDIVRLNMEELKRELAPLVRNRRVVVERGAKIHSGVQVLTEKGPVFLDRGAEIRPGSVVEGPCYIGAETVIDGALVRPGCSFGPQCRIGGEVEECVFQGYANKHHEGFLGHSFVGEWVNLGALTTNSNLKNNYRPVRVKIGNKRYDTRMIKLGCFIGDHVKTAIGTLLPSGAVLGTFANWFESGVTPRELPNFSWGRKERWRQKDFRECARRVMARRGVVMSPVYEKLLLRISRRKRIKS